MSKIVKSLIAQSLEQRYQGVDNAVWVELTGADGLNTTAFRRDLRTHHMRLEIVKTALFRRATKDRPLSRLADHMTGPSALITGGESPQAIAKQLSDWLQKLPGLKLRGALIEGELIDESRVGGLAKMPTRRELQGRVAAAMRSPGSKLSSAIRSSGARIASCVKSIAERLEKGESIVRRTA